MGNLGEFIKVKLLSRLGVEIDEEK